MKVNLQKNKAVAAAMLLTMCCYGQAWAEDSIKVEGNKLIMESQNTATYEPANNAYLQRHNDGVYYFENNGKSFDSIEWSGEGDASGLFNSKKFLDGDRDYTILTKNLTINYSRKNVTSDKPLDYYTLNVASGKTTNIGLKENPVETIKMTGGIANQGTINIFADKFEGKDLSIGGASYSLNDMANINAKNVIIKGDALYVHANVNINQDESYKTGTVKIDGNFVVGMDHNYSNKKFNINFYGKDSYFNGSMYTPNGKSTGAYLTFDQGAKWNVKDVIGTAVVNSLKLLNSSVLNFDNSMNNLYKDGELVSDGYIYMHVLEDLDASNGIIKMGFDGSKEITLDNFQDPDYGYHGNYIEVEGKHIGDTSLILSNTSEDTSKVIGRVLVKVKDEEGTFNVIKTEGALSWTKYELEDKKVEYPHWTGPITSDGVDVWTEWTITGFSQVIEPAAPTTSTKTLLSTITAGYDTWRNDTDKFNERMGELRMNGAGNEGVWVRTKGSEFGRHSSNGSYTNKQQTYQLGYDAVTSKDEKQTTYTGVAAEYGKGSLSFDSGTGTMKSLGLGVYQSQLRESGHYLDLTYRLDKYKNDFHVADSMGNPISGKYGNNAMSLSAEYGRKNALKHGWYVEPQSEVTLGYMFGNDFTTSNNIRVEQKNMPALIGRVGLNIGREVSDKVNFYVKASVNHDFLGNYDMHMTDMSTGERLNASDKFGSSWFDYGAGLSVKTGKDCYAYFDIERAVGGEYKKNWDWNAGVRWSF